jgi:dUTP pyrophosphatase
MISAWNRGDSDFLLRKMERLAQLIIVPIKQVSFNLVTDFETNECRVGGFGSTGTH